MNKTGATRYQKFLKAERAKTKLKSKKELPKGTNITKTNFKVKKIVIKEQLKNHSKIDQLSSRKLSAKELLSRLNHFNTKSRTDALEGLKELITTYPDVLEQNLGQIILSVTPLILNVEKMVRRDTIKVLQLILKNVELEKLDPFFDIMSTYLRSAMTHIDNRIQEDSLQFLDILLICTPTKIAVNFHKVVPNFLDMISKLRVDSKPGRALTVNLNSQITSVKWRIKVIQRLQHFLHKYVEYNQIDNENAQDTVLEKTFNTLKPNHFPMFGSQNIAVCNILNVSNNLQSLPNADEGIQIQGYVGTLMPLLFESWLEVCPNTKKGNSIETIITEDAAILLRHVLNVITLLYKLAKHFDHINASTDMETQFHQKYKALLSQHFINLFPYATNVRLKQAKSNDSEFESVIHDPKLMEDNLELCHLYIKFNPDINVTQQTEELNSVLTFIKKTFSETHNAIICDSILNILYTLFCSKNTGWTKSLTILDKLFKKIIQSYFNSNISDNFKQKIFSLLCEIALDENLCHFQSSNIYGTWLKHLPDILLGQSVTRQTINAIHKFARTNNTLFNLVVKPKLPNIIENLPKITISDCVVGINSYCRLFSLFYWIKSFDKLSLDLLQTQLLENAYNGNSRYVFEILKLRSGVLI